MNYTSWGIEYRNDRYKYYGNKHVLAECLMQKNDINFLKRKKLFVDTEINTDRLRLFLNLSMQGHLFFKVIYARTLLINFYPINVSHCY
jgi:hypothetical protein